VRIAALIDEKTAQTGWKLILTDGPPVIILTVSKFCCWFGNEIEGFSLLIL